MNFVEMVIWVKTCSTVTVTLDGQKFNGKNLPFGEGLK